DRRGPAPRRRPARRSPRRRGPRGGGERLLAAHEPPRRGGGGGPPRRPARPALAERRGITATTVHHGFDERPCPELRAQVRAALGLRRSPLVLQPTRA